ncbi:hypothetical protein K6V92_10480 [Cupriavidus respiraculi]|uniref:hypothetical protein n=1 Tax=Cupriavidus respiraculi TaxID=195930 RepID=UPI001C978D20|nr:hypothetical protein [Cupriavidus respiraculi]MBY4947044.1 hypothetical protein [Cupriavidus respiraculi]
MTEQDKKEAERLQLCMAAIKCPHEIDANRVILHYDDKQPGKNALAQLADRLSAALRAEQEAQEPVAIIGKGPVMSFTHLTDAGRALPPGKYDLYTRPAPASQPVGEAVANPAVDAIQFALEAEDGMTWLRLWNEGEFDTCRREWPEAPEDCYIGADPLHALTQAASTASAQEADGQAAFAEWFVKNYPGPYTIIHDPHWHAPRIYRAAMAAAPSVAQAGLSENAAMDVALRIIANLEDRAGVLDGVDDDTKADIADEIAVAILARSGQPAQEG